MRSLFMGACCATLAAASGAYAQTANPPAAGASPASKDTIEELVVTAQKRSENVQDVPVAITAMSARVLADQRVTTLVDLNNIAPGLRITNADASANPKIFIRGVGLNDFNPSSSSGVGMYVDGVYIGSPLAQMASFFDLDRVEVLRGPQGTLYGRNTTGGAINIITKRPTFTPQGDVSVEYGRFNSWNLAAAYGGPIVDDKLAFRVAGQYIKDDGQAVNGFTGNRVNYNDRFALRGSLLYTPDADTEVVATVSRFANRGSAQQPKQRALFPQTAAATGANGLCASAYYYSGQCTDIAGYADTNSDPYTVQSDVEGKDKVDLWSASINATRHFGDLSLVSITAYQNVRRNDQENTDAGADSIIAASYINTQKQFSQELRLQSDAEPFKWVLGAYYMHDDLTSDSAYDTLHDFRSYFITPTNPTGYDLANSVGVFGYPYTQKTDSYALFGQADYSLTDKLTLTGGLRWSADKKSFDYTRTLESTIVLFTFQDTKTFSDFSGRLGVKYDLTPSSNIYASYNRGYKSGGFFGGSADVAAQLEPYQNETVNAYEVGSKNTFFDRRLRLNLSAFYYDYTDIQAYSTVERGGLSVQILDNAAGAKVYGAELEMNATPIHNLEVSGGLALLHAKYGQYVSEGGDYTGNQMPQAPKLDFNASARYTINLPGGSTLAPSVDVNYRSKIYFDSTETERLSSPSLWLLNGQVEWTAPNGHLSAGVWGKNLADKTYLIAISPIESLGVDLLSMGTPRTYGVFLRYKF